MKELKRHEGWDWNVWFWLDKEYFEGAYTSGQRHFRTRKAVGRDTDGRLFMMLWVNQDPHDWRSFTQSFYELDADEYAALLERAIAQGEVKADERQCFVDKAALPFIPPWDRHVPVEVYHSGGYILGQKNQQPYVVANGRRLELSCHPYEPCLFITDQAGRKTAVHNAFEPFGVLEAFQNGQLITSVTGCEYDAEAFCRMVEYAAGRGDISIEQAEKVFDVFLKQEMLPKPLPQPEQGAACDGDTLPEDVFVTLTGDCPDCVIDYCLVRKVFAGSGSSAHRSALLCAARKLLSGNGQEDGWQYDIGKAAARRLQPEALLAPIDPASGLNYRRAFLCPPHGCRYTEKDFDRVNTALFPNGTDKLEVYQWTTDWSDYFDDGHEWWGALCLTVYDKSMERFVVIMASATD